MSSARDAALVFDFVDLEMAGYDYRQKLGQAYDGAAIMYKNIITD